MIEMKSVDEPRLESDLAYRCRYLMEFVGFGPEDVRAIRAVSPMLLPLAPHFVDGIYMKLLHYDATRRHFTRPQRDYHGELPAHAAAVTPQHQVIQFRKHRLADYFRHLFAGDFEPRTAEYFDFVGRLHHPADGGPPRRIPLVQMHAMLAFLTDAILAQILRLPIDADAKLQAARAFNKLLWLQNDLIDRHYLRE
jgi:hypothetical protein